MHYIISIGFYVLQTMPYVAKTVVIQFGVQYMIPMDGTNGI